jgi:hypothetical protein
MLVGPCLRCPAVTGGKRPTTGVCAPRRAQVWERVPTSTRPGEAAQSRPTSGLGGPLAGESSSPSLHPSQDGETVLLRRTSLARMWHRPVAGHESTGTPAGHCNCQDPVRPGEVMSMSPADTNVCPRQRDRNRPERWCVRSFAGERPWPAGEAPHVRKGRGYLPCPPTSLSRQPRRAGAPPRAVDDPPGASPRRNQTAPEAEQTAAGGGSTVKILALASGESNPPYG